MNILLYVLISITWEPLLQDNQVCLNPQEKELVRLINEYRKSKKLQSIAVSSKLTLVAQAHAKDLASNYNFDPNGSCNPHSWSDKGNWTPCCYTSDHKQAECMWNKPLEIAGYEGLGYEIAYYSSAGATAKEGLEGWKKSKGHNPLLINSGTWKQVEWESIGVGIYEQYAVVWFGQLADNEVPCEKIK